MADETLAALAAKIRAREISPVEVTEACLARIETLGPRLHAFVHVDAEAALRTARIREAEVKAGRARGPLHGVPLAHKDLFVWGGRAASCGTAVPEYFRAEQDATAVARLEAAGAISLGRLNLSELALGPFGDNAHHGDVETPWRPGHCAGGSSSGSGAAVAAGLAYGALGTDTGGSIRLPAACCGIVGLKPTYGRVSRAGAMPLSWSLDHVGPLARTVRDAAILLGVIAGADAAGRDRERAPGPGLRDGPRPADRRAPDRGARSLLRGRPRPRGAGGGPGGDRGTPRARRPGRRVSPARSDAPQRPRQRDRPLRERRGPCPHRARITPRASAGRPHPARGGVPRERSRLSSGDAAPSPRHADLRGRRVRAGRRAGRAHHPRARARLGGREGRVARRRSSAAWAASRA